MAKTIDTGVKPGVISVPATKAKATAPKANGVAGMPKGDINPFIGGKGKK